MSILWDDVAEERYCVDTGNPMNLIPGGRCVSHGASRSMCYTAIRDPRCKHPRLSKNHPYPKCAECGCIGRTYTNT